MSLFSTKSNPPSIAMTLFRSADRQIIRESNDDESNGRTTYQISAKLAKERLALMGFTLQAAQRDFEQTLAREIAALRDQGDDLTEESSASAWLSGELNWLRSLTFDAFLQAFRRIYHSGRSVHELVDAGEQDPIINRIKSHYFTPNFELEFPCDDERSLIRVVLEVVDESIWVKVDVQDLINAGYYRPEDDLVSITLAARRGTYAVDSPIILLTEGGTDMLVIERAMSVLTPSFRGYYSFLDHEARPQGGASSLTAMVRAFVAAGIENRIVALFDNDAEGHAQVHLLQGQPLPSNVRVLTCPDIELARRYPTEGPNGRLLQDVNGTACSIEMYYGEDILRNDQGEFIPVRWGGRNERIGRYQGEIQQKAWLRDRVLEKLQRCAVNGTRIENRDWREMRELLERLFAAFAA